MTPWLYTMSLMFGKNMLENIRFVFSGHVKEPGKLISKGDHGNSIFQIGSNYHFEENGMIKMKALTVIARKLLAILFALARDQTTYKKDFTKRGALLKAA